MNFTTLSSATICNCPETASEDVLSSFIRKVEFNSSLKDRDFKTHFERNKKPDSETCDDVCGNMGLSIEVWNEVSQGHLTRHYQEKFGILSGISPMLKPKSQIAIFRLLEGAGVVKHTPKQKQGDNIFHYDLYKSDEFSLNKICLIGTVSLIKANV